MEAVILAAGRGTRMHSQLPKVLHTVGNKPMLIHVINSAESAGAKKIHVVVGNDDCLLYTSPSPRDRG